MKYKCIPCNHEFEAEDNIKPRCPRCLKINDVEKVELSADVSKKKFPYVPIAVLAVVGLVTAFYFYTKEKGEIQPQTELKDTKSLFDELGIPKEEAINPCEAGPKVSAFAKEAASGKKGSDGLEALYRGLIKLKEQGKWRPHHQREAAASRPLTAEKMSEAFLGDNKEPLQATSYELSCFLYAAALSLDIDVSMVEILSFKGEKSPADPEGKLGRFGVVPASGTEAANAPVFDPYGARAKDAAQADIAVMSQREAMAPYFAISALSLLNSNNMSAAANLNDIAIKLDPQNPYYRAGRGIIFGNTGVASEALVEFEKALKARPDAVQKVNIAEILLLSNPFDKRPEIEVMAALSVMPDYARAHALMGMIHLMRDEKAEAETSLSIAERLDPNSPSIAMYWARYYATTMNSDEAVEKAKLAVTLSDRSVSALVALAGIYRGTARFDEMRSTLDEVYKKIESPSLLEQIKTMFGYNPVSSDKEEDLEVTDKSSSTDDKDSKSPEFELKLGEGGLGKAPSLGGNKGLTLDGAPKDNESPSLDSNLKLDLNLNP